MCLLQLYAYEYKCVTDLGPISLTGLLVPFAVHVHCHMIAYVSNVTVIDNVCCIQKDLRHQLLYYCWRPPRRSDDIRNMFFFISCDIEYSFSVTHVYLLFGVIYAMTCMYIYGNKAFWNWNVPWCMSGSLTCGGGENVPDSPGACATCNFTYLARGPMITRTHILDRMWIATNNGYDGWY